VQRQRWPPPSTAQGTKRAQAVEAEMRSVAASSGGRSARRQGSSRRRGGTCCCGPNGKPKGLLAFSFNFYSRLLVIRNAPYPERAQERLSYRSGIKGSMRGPEAEAAEQRRHDDVDKDGAVENVSGPGRDEAARSRWQDLFVPLSCCSPLDAGGPHGTGTCTCTPGYG
jgi:hypothetical protein